MNTKENEIREYFFNLKNEIQKELENGVDVNGTNLTYTLLSDTINEKINDIAKFIYEKSDNIETNDVVSEPLSNHASLFQNITSHCHENFKTDDDSRKNGLISHMQFVTKIINDKYIPWFLKNIKLFNELHKKHN